MSELGSSTSQAHRNTLVALGVTLVSAGFIVGYLVSWEPEPPLADAGDYQSEAVAIGTSSYDGAITAGYVVEWGDAPSLIAPPGLSGVVTASTCRVGARMQTGNRLLDVDGVGRVAANTSLPFYRTLSRGDIGDDVAELRRVLGAAGAGTTFDADLAAGVRQFNTDLGIASPQEIFDPATVIFLPAEGLVVERCHVSLGQRLSEAAPIASSPAQALSLTIAAPPDAPEIDGPWVVAVEGRSAPIERLANGAFFVDDPAELQALELSPPDGAPEGSSPGTTEATVRLASPIESVIVPASSLFTQGETTCVLLGAPDHFEIREVTVLEARLGTVQVTARSAEDRLTGTAVTNAPALAGDRPCPPD